MKKVPILAALYIFFAFLFFLKTEPESIEISYGKNKITMVKTESGITLIDPGFPRRKKSMRQWINYTLMPEIAKNFGTRKIKKVILKKNTASALEFIKLLKEKGLVDKVILPTNPK